MFFHSVFVTQRPSNVVVRPLSYRLASVILEFVAMKRGRAAIIKKHGEIFCDRICQLAQRINVNLVAGRVTKRGRLGFRGKVHCF